MIDTDGPSSTTRDHLRICLECAVPMWIDKLRHQPIEHILERAWECGQAIAEKGDVLQFKGKTKGASAAAVNRCAEGLACLALTAGSVTFLGVTWSASMASE